VLYLTQACRRIIPVLYLISLSLSLYLCRRIIPVLYLI
jgi:hypothetical protein